MSNKNNDQGKEDGPSSARKEQKRYTRERKRKALDDELFLAGNSVLLEDILMYSTCNESLLRSALRYGLSMEDERLLISKLAANKMLVNQQPHTLSRKTLKDYRLSLVSSAVKWVGAVSDCLLGSVVSSTKRRRPLEYVRKTVGMSIEQARCTIALGESLQ